MKIRTSYIIIVFLVFLLILENGTNDCIQAGTVTTVEEKTITSIDTSSNTEIKDTTPEKVPVIETRDQVREVDPDTIPENKKHQVKTANRYQDTTYFKNATVYSDILAEGRILRKDLRAEVYHKEITSTTTKTFIKQPGGLFISPGLDYSPVNGLEALETSLTYIRGNYGLSVGGYWNFRNVPGRVMPADLERALRSSSFGIKLKIHIKL